MSVLQGKHVLVIGDETSQVHNIEVTLEREGATIHATTCDDVTEEMLSDEQIDVIFLNHLHDKAHCERWLNTIQQKRNVRILPIFTLVDDDPDAIQEALSLGAADYFTASETVESILDKVKIVLGDSVNSAYDSMIDIGTTISTTKKTGIRVLIVEDDPLLANLLSAQMERANFAFVINRDGVDVMSDIERFKPNLLILDLMLPGMSGFTILDEIRRDHRFNQLPVFIFSNRDSNEDKQKAKQFNVAGFYVKAMTDLTDLVKHIEKTAKTVD